MKRAPINKTIEGRFQSVLSHLKLSDDGIWSSTLPVSEQEAERKLREQVATEQHVDYLLDIARHHSVPVMDYEVSRFLENLPHGAFILDVGGCWGWHWRKLLSQRPDVGVVIVDFVRSNLHHAQKVLGSLVGTKVALVHADATLLPFPDNAFDGYWTVQTFQHIPDFQKACCEAYRVLVRGGRFACYSLHITPVVQAVYFILGKNYHIKGECKDLFYLSRASDNQQDILSEVFGGVVVNRYTEILFHPDLKLSFSGRKGSCIGQFDAMFGNFPFIGRWLGRQRSFEIVKC